MQITRHWRMNAQRYRLEGVRYEDGEVDLQARPRAEAEAQEQEKEANRELQPVKCVTAA